MSKIYFVTATGTEIGKTFAIEKMCRNLQTNGQKFKVIKPIISGFRDGDNNNDTIRLLRAMNLKPTQKNIDDISPWRFHHALSPNVAAILENAEIEFDEVVEFCQEQIKLAKAADQYLLIEGAGGVATPINNDKLFLDLIIKLKLPTILVIGNYLGTISHTLTALKTLEMASVRTLRIILNCKKTDVIDSKDTLRTLRCFTNLPIVTHYALL